MVSKQEIEFTIAPDGSVEFTVKGLKGRGCEDLAKLFDELGNKTKDERTAEYYEREATTRVTGRQGR